MELIDVVDLNGNKLEYIKERHSNLDNHEYALVIHIWIKNSDGMYLVQQRSKTKLVDPLLWSITSGFVSCGESSLETVNRELAEELSIEVDLSSVSYLARLLPNEGFKHIVDIYLIEKDINLNELMLQAEEVETVDYWSTDEIKNAVGNNVFYNFNNMYENYFENIF